MNRIVIALSALASILAAVCKKSNEDFPFAGNSDDSIVC